MGKSRAEGAWSAKDTFAIPATKLRPAGFTRSASTWGRSVASLTAPASTLPSSLANTRGIGTRARMPLALVTGGSRGIGRAIVERLARDGSDIAFVYRRDEAAAAEVAASVRGLGRRCVALRADPCAPAQGAAAPARLEAEAQPVDVFVGNA